MDVDNERDKIKFIENVISNLEISIKDLTSCREVSLALTKIQEASFWLRYRQNNLKL